MSEGQRKSLIANSDSDLILATVDCEVCYIGTLSESETLHPAIGYRWHDFIHPDIIPNMEAAVKECLRTGRKAHYETSTIEPGILEPVYRRNAIWPVMDEGEAIGLMALSTVITEQKILETIQICKY